MFKFPNTRSQLWRTLRTFPTQNSPANNSYSPSNGQMTPKERQQQIYKTTIPRNEHPQSACCQCGRASNGTADLLLVPTPTADGIVSTKNNNNYNHNNDVIRCAQHGIPSQQQRECCCGGVAQMPGTPTTTTASAIVACMRSSQANKNHTTTATTTTTVEHELSNGIAKLCTISSSQVATVAAVPTETIKTDISAVAALQLPPLLSAAKLKNLSQSLDAFNRHLQPNSIYTFQQRAHFSKDCKDNGSSNFPECGRDRLGLCGTTGEDAPGRLSGLDRLHTRKFNKGLAFSLEERQLLGIQGMLPAVVKSQEEQVQHCLVVLDRLKTELDKFMYLHSLAERNERLFYTVMGSNVAKMLPILYTPTVGLACQNFSLLYMNPKGMYININDKGHVYDVLKNWPETDVRAIVVTDGQRILGLGDLGANGMPIPVGKLSLYTGLAGIKPSHCLPITLDVGTNTQSILDDPLYIGLRHKRVTGPQYDEFVDEFMHAVVRRFGQNCVIQFEDFGNYNAFRLLAKYRDSFCTFNDDIQGTAAVGLAGLLASLKIKNNKLMDNTILFQGAGEASVGIANLCVMAMMKEGLTEAEARNCIWMVDKEGLIVKDHPAAGITEHNLPFARAHEPVNSLLEAVCACRPTVLIGAAAVGGTFTPEILQAMAEINETPIIFALSNPNSKAECTPEQAYTHTEGRCIYAAGSPFAPVEFNGKTFYPGQGNNAYIYPGVALGTICAGMPTISEEVFLLSAEILAAMCTPEDLAKGSLYPPLNISCAIEIAKGIMEYAYRNGLATVRPEPQDKIAFIKAQMYDASYPSALPEVYCWNT